MTRRLPTAAVTLAVALLATGCSGNRPTAAGPETHTPSTAVGSPPGPPPASRPAPTPPATTGSPAPPPRRSPLATRPAADRFRATGLRSRTDCGPAGSLTTIAELTWRPAETRGPQRVVFTPYADGYRTGRYDLTPALDPGATGTSLSQLSPGSVYTWLVLTRHGGTWQPSASGSFTAPICVGDRIGG